MSRLLPVRLAFFTAKYSRIYQDLTSFKQQRSSIRISESRSSSSGSSSDKSRTPSPFKMPHVGIVGGGVSGLRCADVLLQNGFKVTIVEGRDRLGGRIHQMKIPGTEHFVDIGANWIHGTDNNPILDLAKETKTETHSWGEKSYIYDEDGKKLSEEEAANINETMWSIIVDAFQYSHVNSASIDPSRSLYDWFVEKLQSQDGGTEMYSERQKKLILQVSEMWGAFVGSSIRTQSLKFFWLEECIDGENLFCAGTYQRILARIAQPAVAGAVIKYSTTVTAIQSRREDADPAGKVILTTDKGEKLEFDEVVMTTPLGWLKKNQDAFTPPLPARLSKSIDSIGYGCLEKVYISFASAFWHPSTASSPKPADTAPVRSDEPSTARASSDHTGFTQWLAPTYSLALNPQRWNQEAVELASLAPAVAHPTLLFYIFGEQSARLVREFRSASSSSSSSSPPAAAAQITDFFAPYIARLPGYDAGSPACRATGALATAWLADPLAGHGSYCNFQTGLARGDADIEALRGEGAAAMSQRGVWFAGEHAAPFVALGTVTGAWWSGEGVAGRIVAARGTGTGTGAAEAGAEAEGKGGAGDETGDGRKERVQGGGGGRGDLNRGLEGRRTTEAEDKKEKEVNVRGFADQALEK